ARTALSNQDRPAVAKRRVSAGGGNQRTAPRRGSRPALRRRRIKHHVAEATRLLRQWRGSIPRRNSRLFARHIGALRPRWWNGLARSLLQHVNGWSRPCPHWRPAPVIAPARHSGFPDRVL